MVNRGTSDFKGVMTDAKLLFGYNDKRFNEPKEILNKIKQTKKNTLIEILTLLDTAWGLKLLKHWAMIRRLKI